VFPQTGSAAITCCCYKHEVRSCKAAHACKLNLIGSMHHVHTHVHVGCYGAAWGMSKTLLVRLARFCNFSLVVVLHLCCTHEWVASRAGAFSGVLFAV
jgi:hypothetical protein